MRATSGSGARRMRGGDLVAGDPAQRRDLFGHRAADARHGEIDARAELARVEARGMDEKARRRARAGMPMQHAVLDRQHGLFAGKRLADDAGKEPDAALFGLPGRTTIVGSRMPTPSRKPRRV